MKQAAPIQEAQERSDHLAHEHYVEHCQELMNHASQHETSDEEMEELCACSVVARY